MFPESKFESVVIKALFEACRNGDLKTVKTVVAEQGSEILRDFESTASGEEPITAAAKGGHLEVVRFLVEAGADFGGGFEGSPLYWAADRGDLPMIEFLLERGADINDGHQDRGTPLMTAIRRAHCVAARLLLEKGAACTDEYKSILGNSALDLAVSKGNAPLFFDLVARGALEGAGQTPLQAAVVRREPDWMATACEVGVQFVVQCLTKEALRQELFAPGFGAIIETVQSDAIRNLLLSERTLAGVSGAFDNHVSGAPRSAPKLSFPSL